MPGDDGADHADHEDAFSSPDARNCVISESQIAALCQRDRQALAV